LHCCFATGAIAQGAKTDSMAKTFFVYKGDQNFRSITDYFYWLQDQKNGSDSSGNILTIHKGFSVTLFAPKFGGHYDRTIEKLIERKGRWVDSVVIRRSRGLEQEDYVLGGYTSDAGVKYEQGDIKYRETGDSTFVIKKYFHQYQKEKVK
jgi:hypothetical protein